MHSYASSRVWFPMKSELLPFERLNMVHEGLLRSDSPAGTWAITEDGRVYLAQRGSDSLPAPSAAVPSPQPRDDTDTLAGHVGQLAPYAPLSDGQDPDEEQDPAEVMNRFLGGHDGD